MVPYKLLFGRNLRNGPCEGSIHCEDLWTVQELGISTFPPTEKCP